MTNSKLILTTALFLVLFTNFTFYKNTSAAFTPLLSNVTFLISSVFVLTAVIALLLSFVTFPYTTKPVLIGVVLVSSITSHFMDSYGVVIDTTMLNNIRQTNFDEALDLLNLKLIGYLLILGILPSVFIYRVKINHFSLKTELVSKLKVIIISLSICIGVILVFSKFYTSFFREHSQLRAYTNPTQYVYAISRYVYDNLQSDEGAVAAIGVDAKISSTDKARKLMILVVGEAARADRFSINGYQRETNPLLKKEEIISFQNIHSCGTSTAVSLPCMFSHFGREGYSEKRGRSTQNLLDVLQHAGVHVLWRDNNSDSKGVALRVPYEDFKRPEINPQCDVECRDVGMLSGLQKYISDKKEGSIFIVLHQMGNHGPAYYKRYPPSFERYAPTCKTSQFENCTREEINNAYDNAILYTDYFLSRVIDLLKQNSQRFDTALMYMSDHGESLGENGLYLHGLPYFMAPQVQKHVGAFMWLGDRFTVNKDKLAQKFLYPYSHDNLFHTVLGLMAVNTLVYDRSKDISE
jgi:lipid A ethanolaminephosphotransferase